ncbi:hypothetical protein MNEG_14561 [Monoraphidium neglectum]|uniref:Uncharacterized protein n=1 Tax=Monoraphidium neglectum TaxID=145388 RepID=A0A0D2KC02_9CHLO|nr:hypothetical protein MNEG_14561 [Monoraphidium neglectum]KIY93403.1 hypothetical protein MNEG_14561 [Monoraphidium neglectum]|eukprot:XP_013892423.1 hypothetical protein MNEG_14561 [Monoraphidium neglectum]
MNPFPAPRDQICDFFIVRERLRDPPPQASARGPTPAPIPVPPRHRASEPDVSPTRDVIAPAPPAPQAPRAAAAAALCSP